MSTHELFFFPQQPHLAEQPDWPGLQQRLLDEGILLPPVARDIPFPDLLDLHFALQSALQPTSHYVRADGQWRSTGDVVAAYRGAGLLADTIPVRHDTTLEETLGDLRGAGIDLSDSVFLKRGDGCAWGGVRHRPGPELLSLIEDAGERDSGTMALSLLSYEGAPWVVAGENLAEPCLPGTDEPSDDWPPFGTHVDFIGAAHEDPGTAWTDPASGRSYRLLDLDWDHSLGFGYHFLKVENWAWFDHDRFAGLLAEWIGQPVSYSYLHA